MEALSSSEAARIITDLTMPKEKFRMKKWRTGLNDAVMIPDRGFTKQLKKLDPEYEVIWDWGSNRWEIWKFPKELGQEPYHVLTVQTLGRSYRELGADVLINLQAMSWDRFTADQLADYFDEMDSQIQRRKEKNFRTVIEDIALDTFINIHCKIIQVPKSYKIGRAING